MNKQVSKCHSCDEEVTLAVVLTSKAMRPWEELGNGHSSEESVTSCFSY